MNTLRQLAMRDFENRSLVSLLASFPAELASSSYEDIRSLIRSGLAKARSYGIVNEADVTRYFEYMVEYGADFDTVLPTSDWALPILSSPWLTGFEKMNELDDFATFELRTDPHAAARW